MNIDWLMHHNKAMQQGDCQSRAAWILYYLGKFNSPLAKERVLRWLEEAKLVFPADRDYLEDTIRRVRLQEPTDLDSSDDGFDRYNRAELLELYKDMMGLGGLGCQDLDAFLADLRRSLD